MDKPSTSRQQDFSELDPDNPKNQEPNKRKSDSEHEESSAVKKTQCEKNLSLVSVPQTIKTVHEKEVEAVKKTKSLTADLPVLLHILPLIFSYLPAFDLINVRKVCTLWESATNNTGVWKHAPLDVYLYGVKMLPNTPYLHTIRGYTVTSKVENNVLDAVMSNVVDFRNLDMWIWYERKDMPTDVFQNFIKKFPNLESITLSNCLPAMMESLELLSNTCTNLKALTLQCNDIENFSDMCIVISNGFLSLRKLYIFHMFEQMQNFKTGVSILLRKKINQLTDLFLFRCDVHSDVLESIFKSTQLQKLKFGIDERPEIPLDLRGMISLKSLSLKVLHCSTQSESSNNNLMYIFCEIKFPQNLQYLEIQFLPDLKFPTGIIGSAINSLPNLRVLKAENVSDLDFDEQLEKVNKLTNLHTVCLKGCPALSVIGVEYILNCTKLCELDIGDVTFTESTYQSLKDCKYLGCLVLRRCVLNPHELVLTMLSMEYLTNFHIYNCKSYNDVGVLEFLNNYTIEVLKHVNENIRVCQYCFSRCCR